MKILDANILIYASQPQFSHLRPLLIEPSCVVSDFTRLEVLGYSGLSESEKNWFESVFRQIIRIPVTEDILSQAILLRQAKRMSAGDSIIAATALIYGFELNTRNIRDFSHITGLALVNPVDKTS
ncbi:MAG: type II toxin-antitoxin system VapC family toxin [Bacteroidia bacterium]